MSNELIPIEKNGKVLKNDTHILCKCKHHHIHKYSIELLPTLACATCSAGNKKSQRQRELAEKIFGKPFIVNQSVLDIVYVNAKLKIALKCGELLPEDIGNYTIVDLNGVNLRDTGKILRSINVRPKWEKTKLPEYKFDD